MKIRNVLGMRMLVHWFGNHTDVAERGWMQVTPDKGGQSKAGYDVPAGNHRVEDTIKRSRFVTTIARAPTSAVAKEFIAAVRGEFPDATHHCWAYVAGPPGDTRRIGMSDDGEPHGTAGKPMLNVLLHCDVGEIVAVCTRYYGGVKLGTGGLSRAYAGGVSHALETLPKKVEQELTRLVLAVPYEYGDAIQRLTTEMAIVVESVAYDVMVRFALLAPTATVPLFVEGVRGITRGQAIPIVQHAD